MAPGFVRLEEPPSSPVRNLSNRTKWKRYSNAGLAQQDGSHPEQEELRGAAASIVQHWYRRSAAKFSTFGPLCLVRKNGRMADFGSLSFLSGARTANFVTVIATTAHGAPPHRAPCTRCTADPVHRVWHR